MKDRRRSSASRPFWRFASASLATHSVAVAKATRCPARQALIETAIARCVLPVPGGPSSTTFSLACGIGEGQAAGEDAGVAGGELAGVQCEGADQSLAGADFDAATNEARVQ